MTAKLLVVLIYASVLALVLLLPASFLDEAERWSRPWWRNVRFWAAFVAVVQIAVYGIWG